ncbi:MAG: ribulose-phosphate 3-epimerase [Kiritimatiellae bacterium]|nr:ribulose-phosphate 3-epimerase [Kiritimatiellia bacterium]
MKTQILPSLLAADLGRLADELRRAEASGAEAIHIDIMDPTFVPNMSFGPSVVDFCRRTCPGFYRNVHLMMNRPDLYLEKFAKAGAQTLQVHVEADCDLHVELRRIRGMGLRGAIVINPETPVEILAPYLDEIDEALVMTVHPGYGGQKFIEECLPKVAWLREHRPGLDVMVDGGVNAETAAMAAKAGANQFVAGSYLFAQADMRAAVADMKARLA